MSRGRIAVVIAACAVGVAAVIVIAGSDESPTKRESSSGTRQASKAGSNTEPCGELPVQHTFADVEPGLISDGRLRGYGDGSVRDIVNSWLIRAPRIRRAVQAGSADGGHTTGAISVSHFRPCAKAESARLSGSEFIQIPGSGALTITHAPSGAGDLNRAAEQGRLRFEGSRGVAVTLDLDGLRVSCDPPMAGCGEGAQECPSIDGKETRSGAGASFRAWGLDCEAAREVLVSAPYSCVYTPTPCTHAGFTCRENGEGFVGNLPGVCQDNARRIEITWHIS